MRGARGLRGSGLRCYMGHRRDVRGLMTGMGGRVCRKHLVVASCAITEYSLRMKLDLAKSLDRLDLSDCGLEEIPKGVFELEDLKDLSLSGNFISEIPAEIGNLKALERFVVAGNLITHLPESIGKLDHLGGFWCHGNMLEKLPDSFGQLSSLKRCSLSGNRISYLPSSVQGLTNLEVLEAAGNRLASLPEEIGRMRKLKKLVLHGNRITEIPGGIEGCEGLEELMLQGNCLTHLRKGLRLPSALKTLNAADNGLQSFDAILDHLQQLQTVVLYGNKLRSIPEGLLKLQNIKNVWLEGNPLTFSKTSAVFNSSSWSKSLQKVGLDYSQIGGRNVKEESCVLRFSQVCSQGPGYFKLEKQSSNILVVAFGSAPGEPNWAGLLGRVAREKKSKAVFDTLYVVDPGRQWFGGCDYMFDHYFETLQGITKQYDKCVMIGESMGASAALMFADLATSVLAFCPQVDLSLSSIRPSSSQGSWGQLRKRVLNGVAKSDAELVVLSGTWDHDIKQVKQIDQSRIQWKAYSVDSHRLALYLDMNGKLSPLVRSAMGLPGESVRIANIL